MYDNTAAPDILCISKHFNKFYVHQLVTGKEQTTNFIPTNTTISVA